MAGLPSTAGWHLLSARAGGVDLIPATDSPVVARLRAAGAVILGKTNVPILSATGSHASNSWAGVSLNAVDPTRLPGGSSAGTGDGGRRQPRRSRPCRRDRRLDPEPRLGAGSGGDQTDLRTGSQCRRHAARRKYARRDRPDRALRARRRADARRAGRLQRRRSEDSRRYRPSAERPAMPPASTPRRCAASGSASTGPAGATGRSPPRPLRFTTGPSASWNRAALPSCRTLSPARASPISANRRVANRPLRSARHGMHPPTISTCISSAWVPPWRSRPSRRSSKPSRSRTRSRRPACSPT